MKQTNHDFPEPLDVIAVGAHPDDVEIACGGTLAKLVGQGYRVGIIDLTDGEPTPNSPGPETRLAEAQAAAKALGVQERIQLDLPNRRLLTVLRQEWSWRQNFDVGDHNWCWGLGQKPPWPHLITGRQCRSQTPRSSTVV